MLIVSRRSALLVFPLLLAGCPTPQAPCDPTREDCSAQGQPKASQAPRTWCDVIGEYMSGFECLTLAGEVDVESFGPSRDRLSEGTLSTCFGGELPSEIPRKTQPAMLPTYSQDFSSEVAGQSGLDLQKLGTWLPNANIKAGNGSKVSVEISFDALERTQISDISLGFRAKLLRSSAKSTIAKLDSCLRRLCRPEYLTVVEVLTGYPKITITTEGEFDFQSQLGWDTDKVDIGAGGSGEISRARKITMKRKKSAGPIVVAARVLSLSESMNQDGLCDPSSYETAAPREAGTRVAENTKKTNKEEKPAKETSKSDKASSSGSEEYVQLDLFADGLKESVRRILSGKGDDPKEVKVGKKRFKIGDTITLSQKEEVVVVNEEPVSYPNGKKLSFGSNCQIEAGGELEILGFYMGMTPEALVRYKGSGQAQDNKACPSGVMFFYLL